MNRTFNETVLRAIILFIGLLIAQLGVTLFLLADLGSDPFNVLVQGLFYSLQNLTGFAFLTHGRVHIAVCFLIIIVLLIVDRTYVKLGTIICMICGGPIIAMYTLILDPFLGNLNALAGRLLMLVAGCVLLASGLTIVIKSDAGTGPNDLVAVVISEKLHRKFGITRIIVDVCFVAGGYLLGGLVGIGTIICAFCVGPVASYFLPVNEKIIDKSLKRFLSI